MNNNEQKFINDLKLQCHKHDIELFIGRGSKVQCGGGYSAGYFSYETKRLAVAKNIKYNLFLPILVHESCHFDQYLEDCSIWKKYDNMDFSYKFDDIINGKTPINANSFCRTVAKLEWDCERRAVEKIKKYNLDIDIKEYSKQANAYIYFWLHLPKIGKWYSKGRKAPYLQKQLLKVCNPKIDIVFNHEIPDKVLSKLNLIYKTS